MALRRITNNLENGVRVTLYVRTETNKIIRHSVSYPGRIQRYCFCGTTDPVRLQARCAGPNGNGTGKCPYGGRFHKTCADRHKPGQGTREKYFGPQMMSNLTFCWFCRDRYGQKLADEKQARLRDSLSSSSEGGDSGYASQGTEEARTDC